MTFAGSGDIVTDQNAPEAGDSVSLYLTGIVKNPGNPYGVPEVVEAKFVRPKLENPSFENPEEVFPVPDSVTISPTPGVHELNFTVPEGLRPAGYAAWMYVQVGDQAMQVNFPLREPLVAPEPEEE